MKLAFEAFDRRLDRASRAPLAVAFSGGGDSLALLLLAKAWADQAGRPLLALTVDHGLQPAGAEWARMAGAFAERIGVGFRALAWQGAKPATGLPAAARAARHRLIAEAARAAGARVILVGHTLDDQLENVLMRQAGQRLGVLREWSPSPVWPEGRGLFHLRPLLALRRAELRAWLASQGLSWIEDPANADPRHPRTRARAALNDGEAAQTPIMADSALCGLARDARVFAWGGVRIARTALAEAPDAALKLVQIAAACASGRPALPRPSRAQGVVDRLTAGERFTASLGGARLTIDRDIFFTREPGEFDREEGARLPLEAGQPIVWDGRFELTADRPGLFAGPLRGYASRLQVSEKHQLLTVPAAARGALPLVSGADGEPACPILAGPNCRTSGARAITLVGHRFAAACGLIDREAHSSAIGRMAKSPQPSYVGAEYQGFVE